MTKTLTNIDAKSLEWCIFDESFCRELDKRPYVSPSHDRKHGVTQENRIAPDTVSASVDPASNETSGTTEERARTFADDQDLEFDDAPSDDDDAEIPEGSLFDYQVPGVLTKDEVEGLDLDHWHLLVRNALVDLEVMMFHGLDAVTYC